MTITQADLDRGVKEGRRCAHCKSEWTKDSKPVETPRGKMHTSCAPLFRDRWHWNGEAWELAKKEQKL